MNWFMALRSPLVRSVWHPVRGVVQPFFFAIESDDVSAERCVIGFDPARLAKRGELLRIYDDPIHDETARFRFRYLLRRVLEPFVVGVGEIRVVWGEPFESIVILPPNPDG